MCARALHAHCYGRFVCCSGLRLHIQGALCTVQKCSAMLGISGDACATSRQMRAEDSAQGVHELSGLCCTSRDPCVRFDCPQNFGVHLVICPELPAAECSSPLPRTFSDTSQSLPVHNAVGLGQPVRAQRLFVFVLARCRTAASPSFSIEPLDAGRRCGTRGRGSDILWPGWHSLVPAAACMLRNPRSSAELGDGAWS